MTALARPCVPLRALREARGWSTRKLMERIQEQGGEIHDTSTIRNIELGHQPGSKPLMYAWARALGIEDTDIQILPIAHGYDRDSQAAALTA